MKRNLSLTHCLGAYLQNRRLCNWCSSGCEGYGYYRWAWGGITAHNSALIVCEVEEGMYGVLPVTVTCILMRRTNQYYAGQKATTAIDKGFFQGQWMGNQGSGQLTSKWNILNYNESVNVSFSDLIFNFLFKVWYILNNSLFSFLWYSFQYTLKFTMGTLFFLFIRHFLLLFFHQH